MAKPSMTPPAAPDPVCPWPMISFVEEILSESRSSSDAKSTAGKEEKSKGLSINKTIVKMRIAKAKDAVSPASSTHDGTGKTIMIIIIIRPIARKTVGLLKEESVSFGIPL